MKYLTLIIITISILACEKTTAVTGQNLNPLSSDPKTNNILLTTETNQWQIVPDPDAGAWIINTKTGDTQHCWTHSWGGTNDGYPKCFEASYVGLSMKNLKP